MSACCATVVLRCVVAALVASMVVACADARDEERRAPAARDKERASREREQAASAGRIGKAVGIEALVAQRRFAFRRVNGELVAGAGPVRAAVDARGRISVAPLVASHRTASGTVMVPHGPVRLETSSASRGGTPIDLTPGRIVEGASTVEIARRGVKERLRSAARGVEQSWTFEREPEGAGDLLLRVAVSGRKPGAVTKRGVELTADGAPPLRYSHATWVDAAGRRTPLLVRVEGEQLVLAVPADVLASAAYPAVLDPWIGPGRDVSTAATNDSGPALAGDGAGGYLAVYAQESCSAACVYAVYGMHLSVSSATGAVTALDAVPFFIGGGNQPAVAFRGNRYVAVWAAGTGIVGAAITQAPAADPVGPLRTLTDDAQASKYRPSVAAGAGGFLAVWVDTRAAQTNATDIYGAFVTVGAGDVLTPSANVSISHDVNPPVEQARPDVASNGTGFFVVWDDDFGAGNIYGNFTSVSASVSVPAAADVLVSHADASSEWEPHVAFAGGAYLAAWNDSRGTLLTVHGNRATTAPAATDTLLGSDADDSVAVGDVTGAVDGSSFMLTWTVDLCSDGCLDHLISRWFAPSNLAPLSVPHVVDNSDLPYEYPTSLTSGAPGQFLLGIEHGTLGGTVRPALALPNGSPCPTGLVAGGVGTPGVSGPQDGCLSNVCADGVCCNTACNASGACQACTGANRFVAGTSSPAPAGTCGYFNTTAGVVCNATTSGACDLSDICNGTGPGSAPTNGCPNRVAAAGVVCLAASGPCDVADTCDGTTTACAARFAPNTRVCRAGSGDVCDPSERCSGTAAACPSNTVATAGSVCRAAVDSTCNPAETCSGVAGQACPADVPSSCPDAGADATPDAEAGAPVEAGVPDATVEAEAATPDAAEASTPDAAVDAPVEATPDAMLDANPPSDASDAGEPRRRASKRHGEGCGCEIRGAPVSSQLGLTATLLVAGAMLARRRRSMTRPVSTIR